MTSLTNIAPLAIVLTYIILLVGYFDTLYSQGRHDMIIYILLLHLAFYPWYHIRRGREWIETMSCLEREGIVEKHGKGYSMSSAEIPKALETLAKFHRKDGGGSEHD